MRMDRYEDDNVESSKKSRTNKNQELYTDVYLNNAYVDIKEINEVVNKEQEVVQEPKKKVETEPINYEYQEKNYDINEYIKEAIENNNDNLKRSLEQTTEIENIIKTINENQLNKEKDNNLLSDLLADSDTTTIVEPLGNIITNTKELDTSIIHKDEMSNELLEEIDDNSSNLELKHGIKESTTNLDEIDSKTDINDENNLESDDSLKDETKIDKKKLFIIIGIVLLIIIVIVFLIYKKIIKF